MSKKLFRVYRNLHKKCYSVSYNGIVIMHTTRIIADNATLFVSEAGRQRVLATGHKNVHAYVQATDIVVDTLSTTILPAMCRVAAQYPEVLDHITFKGGTSAKPLGDYATPPDGYAYTTQGWITYNPRQHPTWVDCFTYDPCPPDATYVVDLSWVLLRPAIFAARKLKQRETQ